MALARISRHHRVLTALVAGATALVCAGCSAATAGQVGGSASTAAAVHDGGTLVVAQTSDANPGGFLKTSIGNILSEYAVLQTLTMIDPATGQPKGVLATSWTLSPDAESMDIKLRQGVTFHSGAKFTAADVVFTLKQVQDPANGAANQALAAQITSMTAVGDYELKLTFSKPTANIFDLFETMPILNPATYNDYAAGKTVDGTGPFVWKSWTPNAQIVLTKYAGYWDAKDIHLDAIDIDVISSPTALVSAIRSGSAQYGIGMAALDARTLAAQSGYSLVTSGGSAIPLAFDVTQAPFNNPTVRQAIEYAIDRGRIVQQVEGGHAQATDLPWTTSTTGYSTTQADKYTYQPAKAKQMLAQAGVTGATFNVVTLNTPEATGIFQIIQADLAAVGLTADPIELSATDYDQRIAERDIGAPAVLMQNGDSQSPASALVSRPELLASDNLLNFSTPQYTQLVQAVTTASTAKAQATALQNYDAYFTDEAFAVPLITRPTLSVRSDSVSGITATAGGFVDLDQAWLSQ